jgi:hypothetical protein
MLHSVKLASATLAAILLAAISPNAQAWASTLYTGNSRGTFATPRIDPLIDPNATFSIDTPDSQTEVLTLGKPGPASMPNQLTFSGQSFSPLVDEPFSIGRLTYFNGQTFQGTNVSGVLLNLSISILQPAQVQQQFAYNFAFDLTPNTNAPNDDDQLSIFNNPAPQSFSVDKAVYNFELLGLSLDNGNTFTQKLQVPEDQAASGLLFARIKLASMSGETPQPRPVPEPASSLSLLALGVTLMCRYKRLGDQ